MKRRLYLTIALPLALALAAVMLMEIHGRTAALEIKSNEPERTFSHRQLAVDPINRAVSTIAPGSMDTDEYWLWLELPPEDATTETQVSQMMAALLPHLAEQERLGQLENFALVPELGAIHLESPRPELLAQALSWPGVHSVASIDAQPVEMPHRASQRSAGVEPPEAPAALDAPQAATGVDGLDSCYIYENENEIYGTVITPSLNLTLTLKGDGAVKSQITTAANEWGEFRVYFTDTIRGGDLIEVTLPDQTPITIDVVHLGVEPNKATDIIHGTAPANDSVQVDLHSTYGSFSIQADTDASGHFSADFSGQVDIFLGDRAHIHYRNADDFMIELRNLYVPGLSVSPANGYASGIAAPGATVALVLKDSAGTIKATDSRLASSSGSFYTYFDPDDPCAPGVDILVGDRVEMSYSGQPTVTVEVVDVTVNSIDPATDVVAGAAPANGKVEVYAGDSYVAAGTLYQVVTANAAGQYTADFNGMLDLTPGSFASVAYHDAQDNEVYGAGLYAGPYVEVYLNSYDDLWVAGQPNQPVTATLRNALGAIKATASGAAGANGSLYLYFYDSAGNGVNPSSDDQVQVDFGGGVTRAVDVVGVDFVVDRDTRTVYGSGPANTPLRLVYDYYDGVNVTTDAEGDFAHTFGWLTGGYSMQVIYRNAEGNDVNNYGYVPQFTVYPDSNYLYGYGPSRAAVVVTLQDSGGATKGAASGTTGDSGFYWISFSDADVAFGDTVVVDVGPLHYEQEVVTLTIAADTANDVVYGAAPAGGWLNVWADRYFGPYSAYYYKYFYADYAGQFATNFWAGADVRGGDSLEVMYWQDGHFDRVYVNRYAPYVGIYHHLDQVSGYTTPDAVGTVTVRDGGGALKASGAVTGSESYGYFSFAPPGVDIAPGDQVAVQVGLLDQTTTVVPMSGALDVDADAASGVGPANDALGVAVYHWRDTYYSNWTDNGSMQQFVDTGAGGDFSLDVHCLADLELGDYLGLFYIDALDTHYNAYFYTTQPTVTVDSYPTAVQPGAPVEVQFTIADGAHPTNAYVRWDTVSHAADNAYGRWSAWQRGVIGSNVATFNAPTAGTIYFKVNVSVDGQSVWSAAEYTITVAGSVATTLVDPVSGTTNDNTPQIRGVAPPNAAVTLYEGATTLMTATADADGSFTFDIPTPLNTGNHDLHAVSTVSDTLGPSSNMVHLTVSPTLLVDPVHILLTSRGVTQHLRDESGYANLGGRIWTRTGDAVAVAIPISCTNVYTADLYVGGVLATSLLDSGDNVYVGAYTPPGSGAYSVDLKVRCEGPAGPVHTLNLLTGLIDPDGYVYDAEQGPDYRLAGATVTCYELIDEDNDLWQVWNAAIWEQVNPQTTAADGYYSFFTLPGKYKVHVTAPGYWEYESPVLTVVDAPVHHNVGLRLIRYVYLPLVVRNQ